jgi:hypothetical protein
MQEMHKGKLYICYKEASTNQLKKSNKHTKLAYNRLLEGRQTGLNTTGKRAKKHKNHGLPLNTCTRAKEHTRLTLITHDREKSTLSTQAPPKLMH